MKIYTCSYLYLFVTSFLLFLGFGQTIQAQCSGVNEQDSLALVAIYEATEGHNWNNNKHWLTGNVRNWFGVKMSEDGCRVSVLDLNNNKLIGFIPPEIGKLTDLERLNLNSNFLTGSIPPEIGKLRKLTLFTAQQQKLSGTIPSEIGNLNNLVSLCLDRNQLSGIIPPEIGKLTKLKRLKLNRNQLSGSIPSEIGNLTELRWLWLFSNNLSGSIPPEMGNLKKLGDLYLSNNDLTGAIPPELGDLPHCSLWLLDNDLSGCIPCSMQNICGRNIGVTIRKNPQLTTQDFQEFCAFGTGMCDEPPTVEPIVLKQPADTLQVSAKHITNTSSYQLQFNQNLNHTPKLHLFNIMGQSMGNINARHIIFDATSSNLYLDNPLANYPSGIYLLQVRYEGTILGVQLVK